MTITVRLTAAPAVTGRAHNLNGADQSRVDWFVADESVSVLERIRIDPVADLETLVAGRWEPLAGALAAGGVVVGRWAKLEYYPVAPADDSE